MELQESNGAPEVAEHHEVLPQDSDSDWNIAQFIRKTNGLPEAAQVFSARRAGACMRELGVFLRDVAVIVGAEACGQEGRSGCHVSSPRYMGLGDRSRALMKLQQR